MTKKVSQVIIIFLLALGISLAFYKLTIIFAESYYAITNMGSVLRQSRLAE